MPRRHSPRCSGSRMGVSRAVGEWRGTSPAFATGLPAWGCPCVALSLPQLGHRVRAKQKEALGVGVGSKGERVQAFPGRVILGSCHGARCSVSCDPAQLCQLAGASLTKHCSPATAEGDCQSPVAYQEQIYLKSDNHVVHLVKSSAARPWPLRSPGARGVCNER